MCESGLCSISQSPPSITWYPLINHQILGFSSKFSDGPISSRKSITPAVPWSLLLCFKPFWTGSKESRCWSVKLTNPWDMHGYVNLVCFNICLVPFGVTVTKHPGVGLYFCYPLSSSGFVACTSPSPFCQESPAHNISGTRNSAGLATSSCHVLSWRRCSFSRTNIHQFPDSSDMTSRLSIFESNMTSSNIIHLNPSDRTLRLKHDMYWYVLICIDMYWYVLICIDMCWYVNVLSFISFLLQSSRFGHVVKVGIGFRFPRSQLHREWPRSTCPCCPKKKDKKNDEVIFLTFWCGFFNLRTAS